MVALPPGWTTLSIDEKCDLIQLLIDDVAAREENSLSPEQLTDLQRRIAAFKKNPVAGRTWEERRVDLRPQPETNGREEKTTGYGPTTTTLPDELANRSVAEKLELMELLEESVEDDQPISVEYQQELKRRLEELDRRPELAVPWEQAKATILENLRRKRLHRKAD